MGKIKNIYQDNSSKLLLSLQKDLEAKKITENEFNILLGLLLKVELNNFVRERISDLQLDDDKKLTYIEYARTRKFSTAI